MILMIPMQWRVRKESTKLLLVDHLCKSEVGPLQRELNKAQFLLNSYRTKRMFMAKMNIKVRIGKCKEDSCVTYVILYTNDITIQGHHVHCLVSRVNILL